ncbi:Y-family DNA polymerase [Aestuariivirga litoralis]|uniref:Y-family DNA polymerase n=1 Tax=Aestuariivirga litoralis TaxID=2650924 RepID=UPI001FEF2F38|nr:type VI secretion protein ImpB [Aestuariivirga litoralis]
MYLDFDGFFASVEQEADPKLRGKPIGVVPFLGVRSTAVIACSREAKARGVQNVMRIPDALAICPDLVLVPQKPDLYRRAHNTLLAEIDSILPIDTVKSVDELCCRLDERAIANPRELAREIKANLADSVGPFITCSIGFAANRQLAKIACKQDKPNGVTVWHPASMPAPLFKVPLDDIPGVGTAMRRRLAMVGIADTERLYAMQPKHMRKVWRSVVGETLWYALHGYDVQAPETERGMFGHGRVLPPEALRFDQAYEIARMLLVKAARRLRRESYYCSGLWVWMDVTDGQWSRNRSMPMVRDDHAIMGALRALWEEARATLPPRLLVYRVGVTLTDITPASARQMDMLLDDEEERRKWEAITSSMDTINYRYAKTVVSLGPWNPPGAGDHVGGKISFTRIPSAEDFI